MTPPTASSAPPYPHTTIAPSSSWAPLRLGEFWGYRELLYFLAWRDVKVRYKQTALGVCWAVLQPLFTMLVFSLFFGRLAKIPSDGIPYPVFVYCALLPWQLFAHALTEAGNSLVGSQNLLTKVYFPRLVIPVAAVTTGLVDVLIATAMFVVLLGYYGIVPAVTALALPAFIALALLTALAVGLWLSALNAQYRDVRYLIPFVTQFWLIATPVAYPASLVPEGWRPLLGLNPMAGVIEGVRWSVLGTNAFPGGLIAVSGLVTLILLVTGLIFFRRMERTFADVV